MDKTLTPVTGELLYLSNVCMYILLPYPTYFHYTNIALYVASYQC